MEHQIGVRRCGQGEREPDGETETGRCCVTGFENKGRGHEPRDTDGLQALKKARETDSPPPPENLGKNAALLAPGF